MCPFIIVLNGHFYLIILNLLTVKKRKKNVICLDLIYKKNVICLDLIYKKKYNLNDSLYYCKNKLIMEEIMQLVVLGSAVDTYVWIILIILCFGIWFLIKFLLINSTLDNQKKENNVGCYILILIALIFGVILGIYSLIH